MAREFRSNIEVTTTPGSPELETHTLFDRGYASFKGSPIDEFTKRLRALNSLAPVPDRFDPYMGQLVLLGAVAAVESYLRAVFRRSIYLDPLCREAAMKREVSYAAALHLKADLLPEALLERISFTSKDNIEKACRELLGYSGDFPEAFKLVVIGYVRVCHLRHCAVHRFGKLGASNAVHLGIDKHVGLLEKPLSLDYASLQSAIAIVTAFVRVFNSFLFNALISRLPDDYLTGVYASDRGKFLKYYSLFQDKESLQRSPPPKDAYMQFVQERESFRNPRRRPSN